MGSSRWCIVLAIRKSSSCDLQGRGYADSRPSTGYGAHGDYLFGWVDGSLQKAMDTLGTECFSETCPPLKLQLGKLAIACTKAQQAKEDIGNSACKFNLLLVLL